MIVLKIFGLIISVLIAISALLFSVLSIKKLVHGLIKGPLEKKNSATRAWSIIIFVLFGGISAGFVAFIVFGWLFSLIYSSL